jgi:glycosyltransferase involved in cell wall biosynthesis
MTTPPQSAPPAPPGGAPRGAPAPGTFWFYGTYEPVIPLYETVFPRLERAGVRPLALASRGTYRSTPWQADPENRRRYMRFSWVPVALRANKRVHAVCYWLFAPLKVLLARSRLNVFQTEPPLFFVLGVAISRLRRTPCIVHMMDYQVDMAVHAGLLREGSLAHRVLSRLALWALRRANRVIVLGRCMEDYFAGQGVPRDRIRIVHNWAPPEAVPRPEEAAAFRQEHGLDQSFVVMYSGNMGYSHRMDTVLAVAAELRPLRDVQFVFVGKGVREREIEAAVAAGAPNVRMLPLQPRERVGASISAGHVHFVSLREGCEGRLVPSKAYGIMSCGRPLIYEGSERGEVARIVRESGCGVVVPPGDRNALRDAVLRYYGDRAGTEAAGRRGLDAVRRHYTPEGNAAVLLAVFDEAARGLGAAAAVRPGRDAGLPGPGRQ